MRIRIRNLGRKAKRNRECESEKFRTRCFTSQGIIPSPTQDLESFQQCWPLWTSKSTKAYILSRISLSYGLGKSEEVFL